MASEVDAEISMAWESEHIPDEDLLYRRVHKNYYLTAEIPFDEIPPGAIKNDGNAMSTDWSKYAEPDDTRRRLGKPEDYAVIAMPVGKVRAIPNQNVTHTPDMVHNNRAHTDVAGEKSRNKNRDRFLAICWVERPLQQK